MNKRIMALPVFLLCAFVAGATDNPQMETYLGYSFVRFNPASGQIPSFNANGGNGQFVYNIYKWLGAVGDVGAVNQGGINGIIDTTVVNFVAGPRIALHTHSRFTPFGEVMFGGVYGTTSARVSALFPALARTPNFPVSARLNASEVVFAMMTGGGLDIKVSRSVAIRPIAADYYLTRVPDLLIRGTNNWHNWRLSAGVNFMFGAQ